jgi:peptide/nickel transport system permease protein
MDTIKRYWEKTRKEPLFLMGYAIVISVILMAIFAEWIAPYDPIEASPYEVLLPPSSEHLFGTDSVGMDIFSRVIFASRIDLSIAFVGTFLSVALGVPLGVISGFRAGLSSSVILRSADIVQSFPVFVLAMVLVAVTGNNVTNIIYAIAFVNAPIYLRLTRSVVLSIRERLFVDAARVSGNSEGQIIFNHVLPNSWTPALVQASVNLGWAILLTAGLSFVGAGVRAPTPEWGSMISIGAPSMITGEWWMSFFPGVVLGLSVLGFALVGDSIRLYADPRSR